MYTINWFLRMIKFNKEMINFSINDAKTVRYPYGKIMSLDNKFHSISKN